jgi:hypothetical protein
MRLELTLLTCFILSRLTSGVKLGDRFNLYINEKNGIRIAKVPVFYADGNNLLLNSHEFWNYIQIPDV